MAQAFRLEVSRIVAFVLRPLAFGPLLLCLGMALSLWFANRGLPVNDEVAVLALAGRIRRGSVFYRDIDSTVSLVGRALLPVKDGDGQECPSYKESGLGLMNSCTTF